MTPDLFTSTAHYYARFRKPYPAEVLEHLRSRFNLDGARRLLDVGCGTGEIAIPLAKDFGEVVAIDADADMISEAEQETTQSGISNVQFLRLRGEDISPDLGQFRLFTLGQALHWMNIDLVLGGCRDVLEPGGGIALVGSRSIWGGTADWELAVIETVKRWLGDQRRAGAGTFSDPDSRYQDSLRAAGFASIDEFKTTATYEIDISYIIGHLYSTSYCNRALLGDSSHAFETDLAQTLTAINPAGVFTWELPYSVIAVDKSA